ncbi:MAG: D-alanyl-D-alanine carboxypeptidase [Nitrospirae bacterium]|nr:D-alanyl-D-alanine carboxypeptidase [Nitrospirota bacterium]
MKMRMPYCFILGILILMTVAVPAFAEDVVEETAGNDTVIAAPGAPGPYVTSIDDTLDITARSCVVMDARTGEVIISKNRDLRLPQASTTKVMSAIVALEKTKLDDTFRVSRNASLTSPVKVYLKPGDEITVEALLYAIMLKSANDGAVALAEGIAGSEPLFARMMTEKAREIGAFNTNFQNASGLPADDHYSTAYDVALILDYAIDDPRFWAITGTKTAQLNMGEKDKMLLKNHNKLLWSYEGAGPGKTGYTRSAKHCFVGEASCNNMQLIVSVLGSDTMWTDVTKLLDKGFELSMAGRTLVLPDDTPSYKKASYTTSKHKRSYYKKKRSSHHSKHKRKRKYSSRKKRK